MRSSTMYMECAPKSRPWSIGEESTARGTREPGEENGVEAYGESSRADRAGISREELARRPPGACHVEFAPSTPAAGRHSDRIRSRIRNHSMYGSCSVDCVRLRDRTSR
jgi:hypothetical protein